MSYENWRRRVWNPACERAGLAGLRFHDLRSLAATTLIAAGVDLKTAQSRLGHSSSKVTLDLYARATPDADRRAAIVVGELLRLSRTNGARPQDSEGGGTRVGPSNRTDAVAVRCRGRYRTRTCDLSRVKAAL